MPNLDAIRERLAKARMRIIEHANRDGQCACAAGESCIASHDGFEPLLQDIGWLLAERERQIENHEARCPYKREVDQLRAQNLALLEELDDEGVCRNAATFQIRRGV